MLAPTQSKESTSLQLNSEIKVRRDVECVHDEVQYKQEIDQGNHQKSALERRLLLKSDLLILPLLALTYLVAYLVTYFDFHSCKPLVLTVHQDRNNIGNARLMTLQQDTHMTNEQYFSCVQIFCKSVPTEIGGL